MLSMIVILFMSVLEFFWFCVWYGYQRLCIFDGLVFYLLRCSNLKPFLYITFCSVITIMEMLEDYSLLSKFFPHVLFA